MCGGAERCPGRGGWGKVSHQVTDFWLKVSRFQLQGKLFELLPTYPLLPLQCLMEAIIELHLNQVKERVGEG